MDISIFGYKLNLEVLILIGIVYLILVGHTVCGCCNYGLMEAFETATKTATETANKVNNDLGTAVAKKVTEDKMNENGSNNLNTSLPTQVTPGGAHPIAREIVKSKKEGFTGANINYGESSVFNLNNDTPINTSSWSAPNMTVVPGQPLNPAVKKFLARPKQPVPLPEGELLMFANTEFKPECCPNSYSTSTGCACMTGEQYNYLIERGSNNIPYSEY